MNHDLKDAIEHPAGDDVTQLCIQLGAFMPQTVEHLGILSLLEIQHGIIVLTKTDMVDEDWRELVAEDIRSQVKGTFLEDAPLIPVSSYTGEGIEELRQEIFRQISLLGGKKLDKGAFVSVKLFGSASAREYNAMTAEICRIFKERLGIPGSAVYITYQGINDWGWDGKNF